MKAFDHIYYRLYRYYENDRSSPMFSTFASLLVFAYFNFISLLDLIFAVGMGVKIHYFVGKGITRFWPVLLMAPLFILFRYYLKNKGNHERILNRFKDESKAERRKSRVFVFLYFTGSIALFVGVLWLRDVIRGY